VAVDPLLPEAPQIDLSAATEAELCKPGAVKLLYGQLTELKAQNQVILAELKAEKDRNQNLNFQAHTSDTESKVLRERLGYTTQRDRIVRLIEFVVLGLLTFATDSAKAGSWISFASFVVLSLALVCAILLIQRGPQGIKETK